jgi:hypothetical protein
MYMCIFKPPKHYIKDMHKIKTFKTLNPKPNQDMHNASFHFRWIIYIYIYIWILRGAISANTGHYSTTSFG